MIIYAYVYHYAFVTEFSRIRNEIINFLYHNGCVLTVHIHTNSPIIFCINICNSTGPG